MTFDTVVSRGAVPDAKKRARLDQTAQAAMAADQRLDALRDDLAQLGRSEPTGPRLATMTRFKFADFFFSNIDTDPAVSDPIRDVQDNVDQSVQQVRALLSQLSNQISAVTKQLDAMAAERQQLLAP